MVTICRSSVVSMVASASNTYSIKLRCVAHFIHNIAYYMFIHSNKQKKYHKVGGITRPPLSIQNNNLCFGLDIIYIIVLDFHLKQWVHWWVQWFFK